MPREVGETDGLANLPVFIEERFTKLAKAEPAAETFDLLTLCVGVALRDPNARDEYNLTAFIWCARKGHIAVARVLTAAGADIEARDNVRRTAIHHAVFFRRLEFIDYLLSIGADMAATEIHGCSALDLALYEVGLPRADPKIVARLIAAGAPAPKHPEHIHATAGNA